MTEIKTDGNGIVRIADEVLAVIAGTAALEADWVSGLAGYFSNDINDKAVRKHLAKGVSVSVKDNAVNLGLSISIKFGKKLHEVSADVQSRVKTAIETMTGLVVNEVNVSIGALVSEKRRPSDNLG